jgi:hypothetical protein
LRAELGFEIERAVHLLEAAASQRTADHVVSQADDVNDDASAGGVHLCFRRGA